MRKQYQIYSYLKQTYIQQHFLFRMLCRSKLKCYIYLNITYSYAGHFRFIVRFIFKEIQRQWHLYFRCFYVLAEQVSATIRIAFSLFSWSCKCMLTMQAMLCVAVMPQWTGHILVTWVPVQSKHRRFLPTRGPHGWLDDGSHFPGEAWKHYGLLISVNSCEEGIQVSIHETGRNTRFSPYGSCWSRAAHIKLENLLLRKAAVRKTKGFYDGRQLQEDKSKLL